MNHFVEMRRDERAQYFWDHGLLLTSARAEFEEAVRKYGATLRKCAAFESGDTVKVEDFLTDVMDRADRLLAEEVRDHFGV